MRDKVLEILTSIRPDVDFENEAALIDDEILESFDVIQIVTEFMEAFDIRIDGDDIETDNLNNIDLMVEFIKSKQAQ